MIHNTRQLVENSPFFENLPSYLILRIIAALSIELYLEDDVIYTVGETGASVFFITLGSVAFYSSSGKEIGHYTDGDYFGEMSLVTDVNYRFCKAIALETTECYK
jgi:signal-transduction protein with cAMP-binding, CBS, and nucleotidyltransferase domain